MSDNLFSPFWYRVAQLKPRLRSHAEIHRHTYRGQLWYVLEDRMSGRHHRFSPAANHIMALMDGNRTVDEIWNEANTYLGDDAPAQGAMIRLLAKLHVAEIMACDATPDTEELFARFTQYRRSIMRQRFASPLNVKIPLVDPDAFLERWLPFARPAFSRFGMLAWVLLIAVGALSAATNGSALLEAGAERFVDPIQFVSLLLTYPIVKAIHEFGHAFATKVWGGPVHEMGITFLVFMPIPYVDASAASSFGDKRKRMIVGAAGVMVELGLASLALFLWLHVEPGIVRSIAYDVLVIGGLSTLLFNGNPLLRFDGYYVLADALELPNLHQRSSEYLGYLFQHHVLGLPERRGTVEDPGERFWFVGFGVTAFIYKLVLAFVIALFVADQFFFVGVLIAIFSLVMGLVLPAIRSLKRLSADPRLWMKPRRVFSGAATIAAGAGLLLFAIPFPLYTGAQGVVWLPEQSQLRAGADGFVSEILAPPDSLVEPGQPLVATEDPLLTARLEVLEAKARELRARYEMTRRESQVEAEIAREELHTLKAELARARQQARQTIVHSPVRGRFVLLETSDLEGRYVERGELLGYVARGEMPTVRAVVGQKEIARVREQVLGVEIRLADRPWEAIAATIAREVPGGSNRLPSAALGGQGGGPWAVAADEEGLTTVENVFQIDMTLPGRSDMHPIGARAYVRFDHGSQTLAPRLFDAVRRLFLGRFRV
jgi:putative peptide zinc metalloprotease protein